MLTLTQDFAPGLHDDTKSRRVGSLRATLRDAEITQSTK